MISLLMEGLATEIALRTVLDARAALA